MSQARSTAAPIAGQPPHSPADRPPQVAADVAGPAIEDLPAAATARWVPRRKALVVAAVRSGLITVEEACRRYALSPEEFQSWCQRLEQFGLNGLRVSGRPPG